MLDVCNPTFHVVVGETQCTIILIKDYVTSIPFFLNKLNFHIFSVWKIRCHIFWPPFIYIQRVTTPNEWKMINNFFIKLIIWCQIQKSLRSFPSDRTISLHCKWYPWYKILISNVLNRLLTKIWSCNCPYFWNPIALFLTPQQGTSYLTLHLSWKKQNVAT